MEIRINPTFIDLCSIWRVACENTRDLVAKGVTWDLYRPGIENAANATIRPDYVDIFLRLCELAFEKYEKEMLS